MKEEKFKSEIEILKKFFVIYCKNKHQNQIQKNYSINYKSLNLNFGISLCNECHNLLNYAVAKLIECPHNPKPRCRKCPNPCYEKDKYKQIAKIMKFSGIKIGLIKINKLFKKS